jgi:hypothetical protein
MACSKLAFILLSVSVSAASAQQFTKDQCLILAKSMPAAGTSLIALEQAISRIDWDQIIPHVSGQFRTSSELSKRTQQELLLALQKYRAALEDVSYQSQLCAR